MRPPVDRQWTRASGRGVASNPLHFVRRQPPMRTSNITAGDAGIRRYFLRRSKRKPLNFARHLFGSEGFFAQSAGNSVSSLSATSDSARRDGAHKSVSCSVTSVFLRRGFGLLETYSKFHGRTNHASIRMLQRLLGELA